MTQAEQELVLNNLWIVNTVCKQLHIKDYDIRADLTLFLCELVSKVDKGRENKPETYLFKSVYLRALRLLKNANKKRLMEFCVDDLMYKVANTTIDIDNIVKADIIKQCAENDYEKRVIEMLECGAKTSDIAIALKCNIKDIYKVKNQIATRAKSIIGDNKMKYKGFKLEIRRIYANGGMKSESKANNAKVVDYEAVSQIYSLKIGGKEYKDKMQVTKHKDIDDAEVARIFGHYDEVIEKVKAAKVADVK